MIALLILTLASTILRLRHRQIPYKYSPHLVSLYRDITFFLLMAIFMLEMLLDYTSYSLLLIPYFVTPFIAYATVEFRASAGKGASALGCAEEVESYVTSLLLAAKKISSDRKHREISSESKCYLLAMLDRHIRKCETAACICRTMEEKAGQGRLRRVQISQAKWIAFARQQLGDSLLRFPKESSLHVAAACFDFYFFKNYFRAVHSLAAAQELGPPATQLMTILYVEREIEEAMIGHKVPFIVRPEEDPNKLDPLGINRGMKLFNKFMEMLDDCTASNVSFWTLLLSSSPNVLQLNRIGAEIFEYLKRLNEMYNKFIECNSSNVTLLFKYGVFLKFIIFDDITAEVIFNKIERIKENKAISKSVARKTFTISSLDLITMRVSGNLSTLGKILDANSEASIQLKYDKNELKHSNITQLMPSALSKNHLEWVKDAYSRFVLPYVNKVVGNFICNKEGYFMYADVVLSILPNLKDDINFILFIHANKKMSHYVEFIKSYKTGCQYCVFLCDDKGQVIGMNENMGNWLNVTPVEVKNRTEANIENLIPEIYSKGELVEGVMTPHGYRCTINYGSIARQLSEAENVNDSQGNEQNLVSVWVRCIEEVYGSSHNQPNRVLEARMKVFIIIPLMQSRGSSLLAKSLRVPDMEESAERAECQADKNKETSLAGSLTSSSFTNVSNKNLVYEFKAGLYEKRTPQRIRVLKYVVWCFYLVLLASSAADWILSYAKANSSRNFFELIVAATERMNSISSVTIDARTLDLYIRGLEDNPYYKGKFYERTHEHVSREDNE